ncbi:MAG: hybrid sensor histidine kinase/response regulator [Chloroflexi bacterium]|nr:hybrid sensor histidine kinase/response regulator [Chloroflexota bacterium]MCL5275317.1 hybrid sensor histidine kinase/response regulator [Chloroflexota bacterium]
MTTQPQSLSPAWSTELETMIQQVREESITLASLCFGILTFILLGYMINHPEQPARIAAVIIVSLVVTAGVWALHKKHYPLAAWTLIICMLLVDTALVTWVGIPTIIVLLVLPVGLATLTVSRFAGVAVALLCTAFVALLQSAQISADFRTITIVSMWSVVGMIWLTLRPLLTAVEWAWSGYENSQVLLDQEQGHLLQLQEALKDLAEANVQLTRLNQQSHALRQIAEDSQRTKEQFAANISHELRTPLNMITGFCEMIMQTPELYGEDIPPALLADLAVVLRNSQHLANLVDDVLDLSQVDAGLMALTRERVSLAEIVQAARVAVGPLFTSKGLYLHTDIAADLPLVYCDRTRIREVLLNLLSNAGRFTQQGGITVRAWRDDGDIVTSVQDTGPGISAADQDRLFRPFEQLDGSIRRRYGGTGLGLSISKSFVELHDGKMWVESEPGVGTTFFFRLPIDPLAPITGGATRWLNPYQVYEKRVRPSHLHPTPVKPRFIVMGHSDPLQRLLTRYAEGAEIVAVNDMDGAGQVMADTPAQALLLNTADVEQALDQVRESRQLPYGTPAIVSTIPGMDQAASGLGVKQYLIKPVTREKLLTALDSLGPDIRTVLVVDDEPDAQQLFRRMLATAPQSYRVLRASDGQQALALLRTEKPDVVLLDLIMPGMDGFKFLEAKSSLPDLREIPVILVSAQDPFGQPIVSTALAVTCRDGLSARQMLDCIEALSVILSTATRPGGPVPQEVAVG